MQLLLYQSPTFSYKMIMEIGPQHDSANIEIFEIVGAHFELRKIWVKLRVKLGWG